MDFKKSLKKAKSDLQTQILHPDNAMKKYFKELWGLSFWAVTLFTLLLSTGVYLLTEHIFGGVAGTGRISSDMSGLGPSCQLLA